MTTSEDENSMHHTGEFRPLVTVDQERMARLLRAIAAGDAASVGQVMIETRTDERGVDSAIIIAIGCAQLYLAQLLTTMDRSTVLAALDSELIRLIQRANRP